MKKIRVKALKGNKEIMVSARRFCDINKFFGDYFIVPEKTENVDSNLVFKKIVSNIERNGNTMFFDVKKHRNIAKKGGLNGKIGQKNGTNLTSIGTIDMKFDGVEEIGKKIRLDAKKKKIDIFD